jgi:tRNA (cmo5U34)-methyltransferase
MMGAKGKKLETMQAFFDARSAGYDRHMEENVADFSDFYEAIARQIPLTASGVDILDLGCGTGLELEFVFNRAPQAQVTGIDLSARMLAQLREKFSDRLDQLTLSQASYLDYDLGQGRFKYCISVMTLHHLPPAVKLDLYSRILAALKPGGRYIEGDYVVSRANEVLVLADYQDRVGLETPDGAGKYHLDLPLSRERQIRLLKDAGFSAAEIVWDGDEAAVFAARANGSL